MVQKDHLQKNNYIGKDSKPLIETTEYFFTWANSTANMNWPIHDTTLSIELSTSSSFEYLAIKPNEQKHRDYYLIIETYCDLWFILQVEVYSSCVEEDG